jgi:hypothetical protein
MFDTMKKLAAESPILPILVEAGEIGGLAAVFWPFKAISAAYGAGLTPSWQEMKRNNRGYLSLRGVFSANPPQWYNVFRQMAGNLIFHRAAELHTDSLLLISVVAALGAAPGTVATALKEAGQKISLSTFFYRSIRTKPHFLVMAYMMELLREAGYNWGCLHGVKQLQRFGLSETEMVFGVGAIAALTGFATGLPNGLAGWCYIQSIKQFSMALPGLRNAVLSMLGRAAGICCVFTSFHLVNQVGLFSQGDQTVECSDSGEKHLPVTDALSK